MAVDAVVLVCYFSMQELKGACMGLLARLFGRKKFAAQRPQSSPGDDGPMIAIVALRATPRPITADEVEQFAIEHWGFIPDATSDNPGNFVAGELPTFFVRQDGWMHLVHSFRMPYVRNAQEVAETTDDVRMRDILLSHTAWMSVDTLHMPDDRTEADAYHRCGTMLAALLDDDCLGIHVPDDALLMPFSVFGLDQVREALRQPDPRSALRAMAYVPVVQMESDDPRMQAAVDEARARWQEFVDAFQTGTAEHCAIKAPITVGDNTEFIWLDVTAVDGDTIRGNLANDPMDLGALREGDEVETTVDELNDWIMVRNGERIGGFTVNIVAPGTL